MGAVRSPLQAFKRIVATVGEYEHFLATTILGGQDVRSLEQIRQNYAIRWKKLSQDCTSYQASGLHLGGHREAVVQLMLELPREVKWVEQILRQSEHYPGYSLGDAVALQRPIDNERASHVRDLIHQSELTPDLTSASTPTDLDELRHILDELKGPLPAFQPFEEEPTDVTSLPKATNVAVTKIRKRLKGDETTTALEPEFQAAWDARVGHGSEGIGSFMRTGDPISVASGYYARYHMQEYFRRRVQPAAAEMAAQLTSIGMESLYEIDPSTNQKVVTENPGSYRKGAALYHSFMAQSLAEFPQELVEGAAHVYASVRIQSRQYISEKGTTGTVEKDESFSKELARFSITNMLMLRAFNTGVKYPFYKALGRYADP